MSNYGPQVSTLLKVLESPTAKARGIETPRNTTFRVLKEVLENDLTHKQDKHGEPEYQARQIMGEPRSPERLRAGLGGIRLPTEEIVNAVRFLLGKHKGNFFRLDEHSHGYYEDAAGNRVDPDKKEKERKQSEYIIPQPREEGGPKTSKQQEAVVNMLLNGLRQ